LLVATIARIGRPPALTVTLAVDAHQRPAVSSRAEHAERLVGD